MSASEPIAVYIGTDDTQLVPAIVMAETLRRSPAGPRLAISFLQADSGRLLAYDGREVHDAGPLPMRPYERPERSGTRFSLARFTIPELQGWTGTALYFDSDQLCFGDPQELGEVPLDGACLAACPSRRPRAAPHAVDTSVMLLHCGRCAWRVRELLDGLEAGRWRYWDLMGLSGAAARLRPAGVALLDPAWNTYDVPAEGTRLLHYTTREHQPWKNDHLPSAASRALWEAELQRTARDHPLLARLVRDGVAAGFLKPRLLALLAGT